MIYGYLIIAPGGLLITHKLTEKIFERKIDISLLSNGIYALSTFFGEVLGRKLEEIIGRDYKFVINEERDLIIAFLSDIDDNNARILAKKYLKRILNELLEKNIVSFDLIDHIVSSIKNILSELDEEIRHINEKFSDVRYV